MDSSTKIARALAAPGMEHGPYLLFLRSSVGHSAHHDFDDWDVLANTRNQQAWGENGVITLFSKPAELGGIEEIPDWVEFLELASISTDFATYHERDRATWVDLLGGINFDYDDDDFEPTFANMMIMCSPGATPDKPTFDRRLLTISFFEEAASNLRATEAIKRRLGQTAVGVWHSRDMEAVAFRDSRSPTALMAGLSDFAGRTDAIYDLGVFRLAAAAPLSAPLSPLQTFLTK